MNNHTKGLAVWGVIGLMAISGFVANRSFGQGEKEAEVALPAATVTRAINTAVAAKAGNVAGVEMETENGVTKIDVEIAATDGNNYEVAINAATGKVIAVELDNENENEAGEAGEKGEMNEQGENDKD